MLIRGSLVGLFASQAPDGIVLATPTPLHVAQGLMCIDHRCPVLVEKPISDTTAQARLLTDAATIANVQILVGHHRRHSGIVRAAKQALVDGAIGDVRAVQATCWLYKPNEYFDAALWRTRKGAGPISVNLVHDVDLLRHFCGEVSEVSAVAVPAARGLENEDLAIAILSFESGVLASISVSDSIAAPWSWEMTAGENPVYPQTNQNCYLIGGRKGALSLPDLSLWHHEGAPDWWAPLAANALLADTKDPLITHI